MVAPQEELMGRFSVDVELANNEDLLRAKDGRLPPEQVRRARAQGIVDSGATLLVVPKAIIDQLGLGTSGQTRVQYADGRTAHRDVAEQIRLKYGEREGTFNAIVEPNKDYLLIGAIVLEQLDLLVDCKTKRLMPRDPKETIFEVE